MLREDKLKAVSASAGVSERLKKREAQLRTLESMHHEDERLTQNRMSALENELTALKSTEAMHGDGANLGCALHFTA